ncbi:MULTISPECIES: hypothetical protein [Sphingomonas]|uniref:Uncharacterized protein n=1 Tax=Sphingomonas bisphenolicum TaxID=296544 RepID=A0ABM7G5I4_9SPHN|nr:hypothetical protein [Sphingomonas bisphenolicum]BBF71088.1 hypothetical protein SBA_ch1_32880 [Sphingomonas bisphenolicum]
MLIFAAALLLANDAPAVFPEKVPGLTEACLEDAVAAGEVTDTDDSHKYICVGDTAAHLWTFLEGAGVRPYEQDTPEGRWLSREFPLGGCFKRIQLSNGEQASTGLSCTIWVPRPVVDKP